MNRTFLLYVYCGWRLNVPVVVSEHCDPAHPRSLGRFGEREREVIFSGADRIHLLSGEYVPTLPEHLRSRVSVIPNTVRPARQPATPGRIDGNYILSVARLSEHKKIDLLITAFAQSRLSTAGWRLKLVGYGKEERKLRALVRELSLEGVVDFVGRVNDPYPLYEQASIYALPSWTEGFALTTLEAMAHGLPVVGFQECSGLIGQVVDGFNGVLCERRVGERNLAEALIALAQSPELRIRYGRNGRELFETRYHHDSVLAQWERMVVDVAGSKRNKLASMINSEEVCAQYQLLSVLAGDVASYTGKELR